MWEENMKFKFTNILAFVSSLFFVTITNAADSELIVFDWGGYEDPAFFGAYVEKYGDSPTYSFFSDEEEAFQKVKAGFKADLGHPCSQSVVKWRNADIIVPIDTDRLKNWSKVDSGFANMEGFLVDGVQWALPIDWGATALTYNAEEVTEEEASSLLAFADPKFKGRVSLIDNVDVRGAKTLGNKLERHEDDAFLARKLTGIDCYAPLESSINLKPSSPDLDGINKLFNQLAVGTALRRQADRINHLIN